MGRSGRPSYTCQIHQEYCGRRFGSNCEHDHIRVERLRLDRCSTHRGFRTGIPSFRGLTNEKILMHITERIHLRPRDNREQVLQCQSDWAIYLGAKRNGFIEERNLYTSSTLEGSGPTNQLWDQEDGILLRWYDRIHT